ncbi:hypothetical protein KJ708_09520, partial [bacterium]|nr:hypothetical protein [bacterium]
EGEGEGNDNLFPDEDPVADPEPEADPDPEPEIAPDPQEAPAFPGDGFYFKGSGNSCSLSLTAVAMHTAGPLGLLFLLPLLVFGLLRRRAD